MPQHAINPQSLAFQGVAVDDEQLMRCPSCGRTEGLHIDQVELHSAGGQVLSASAGGEDDHSEITLSLGHGSSESGRRHRIALLSWCELCGARVETSFRQHKGLTEFIQTVLPTA